jgi:cell division protein FtsI (penicillin-binding protein 3)
MKPPAPGQVLAVEARDEVVKFTNSPLLSQRLPAWRARFVAGADPAGLRHAGGALVYLQGFNNDFLQHKGESRYARVIEISATRGRITDRSGDMLAVSTPVKSVWAIPEDARLTPAQARELAALLEMDVRELNRRLAAERDFVLSSGRCRPTWRSGSARSACPASTRAASTAATTRPAR